MARRNKTYYGMYSKDGFGVYTCRNRLDDAFDYTYPIEIEEFQNEDEAVWFAQDGFDSLGLSISSEELIGDDCSVKINWFYRIDKRNKYMDV